MTSERYLEYIKETIREVTKERGITYDEVSKLSGVPRATVGKIMCGETLCPRKETLDKLAKAFDVKPFDEVKNQCELVDVLQKLDYNGQFSFDEYKASIDNSICSLKELKKSLLINAFTYAQLSELTGIPVSTIEKIMQGRTAMPNQDTLEKLYSALDYSNLDVNISDGEIIEILRERKNEHETIESYKETLANCQSELKKTIKVINELIKLLETTE